LIKKLIHQQGREAEIMKRMFYAQLKQATQIFSLPFISLLYNGASNARGIVPIGRTAVSKTDGWGFESLCPCHFI
jgi:hypothetical protein